MLTSFIFLSKLKMYTLDLLLNRSKILTTLLVKKWSTKMSAGLKFKTNVGLNNYTEIVVKIKACATF